MNRTEKRRAFGQHFLNDKTLSAAIVTRALEEAQNHHCQTLLEIGPGRGALTLPLIDLLTHTPHPPHLLLVEKDYKLAQSWLEQNKCEVISADFLTLSPETWANRPPIAVLSNLPYSSGTAILKTLANHPAIPVMVLMFQAEVAQRLRAEPNSSARGSLSVWIQNHWDVQLLHRVPPASFTPPPKVNSEVLLLTRRPKPLIPLTLHNSNLWDDLLRLAFSQRRKMLRTLFKPNLFWKDVLAQSSVGETKRAEALDLSEWQNLFDAAVKAKGKAEIKGGKTK